MRIGAGRWLRGTSVDHRRSAPPSLWEPVGGPTARASRCVITLCLAVAFGLLGLAGPPAARAASVATVTVAKTFDHGTLIEHTISAERGPFQAALHLRQRRQAEGSPIIVRSDLDYRYDGSTGAAVMPADLFEALVADLIRAVHERFGTGLELERLDSGGFLGLKEIEKRSIMAFADFEPWQRYLLDPQAFSQVEIHTLVSERWQTAGVFAPVASAFAPLGYTLTLAGFEKLSVFPAEKCSFYLELVPFGIRGSDRFPYPGRVSFALTPIH